MNRHAASIALLPASLLLLIFAGCAQTPLAPQAAVAPATANAIGAECRLDALPIPDRVRDAVLTPLDAGSTGLSSPLTDNEKYMLTRGYAVAIKLKNTEKTCERHAGVCKLAPAEDVNSVAWDAAEFWKVIGPNGGCEAADDFKTRFSIDYKVGQIQIATRTGADQYRRIGIDLCRCTLGEPLKVIVRNDLGYGSASTAERAREMGVDALAAADNFTPPSVQGETSIPPRTAALVREIHGRKKLIVATLGFARGSAFPAGSYALRVMWVLAYLDAKLSGQSAAAFDRPADTRSIGGVVTGGYWGREDNVYGVTRAGFDVARFLGLKALVVTPLAGMGDTHVNPDSRTVAGELWGDDSMSLVAATDMAIVFYRSSRGETDRSFGRWTEVEVAHLKTQGVPFVFIDIDSTDLKAAMDAALTNEILGHRSIKAVVGGR